MSYESQVLKRLAMPPIEQVKQALLRAFLKHSGVIKEFGSGDKNVVDELADEFGLSIEQRTSVLQTVYRKEMRIKNALVWHRLLFRAADILAKNKLATRPSQTILLTKKREWMLTEQGFDEALRTSDIPLSRKNNMAIRSFEVEKIANQLCLAPRPTTYDPINKSKKKSVSLRHTALRIRGFRQAITEAYHHRCSVCGLKMCSPEALSWEVEAAHIVSHSSLGRDDVWNGLALCHLHHWAFDVGWFTLRQDYTIELSNQVDSLPREQGRIWRYEIIRNLSTKNARIFLPGKTEWLPHESAIAWHRRNIFSRF